MPLMAVSLFIYLRLLSFLSLVVIVTAQRRLDYSLCFNNTGFYTTDSTYKTNLHTLLSILTTNTNIDYGFYYNTNGEDPDKVSAVGLCRGDIKPDACRNCLHNASIVLPEDCPINKEAGGGYDECILRYYHQLPRFEDLDSSVYTWNIRNITAPWGQYEPVLRQLLQRLTSIAASGGSHLKFAAAKAEGPDFQTIYAVTQCTPDLSKKDCNDCLTSAISEIPYCCTNRIGARVIKPRCNLRYEKDRFYDPAVEVSPASPPKAISPPSSTNTTFPRGRSKIRSGILVLMVLVVVAVLVMLFGIGYYFLWRKARKTHKGILKENFGDESTCNLEALQFDLATIEAATNNFSCENKIGKGGFGEVYKGVLLDGQETAVKRLSKSSTQGAIEFKNEVLLIAKLQHRNLVALLGFCLEGQEKILIYEYVPNKSLDYFLFDSPKYRLLSWNERYKIIRGIVQAIMYLHEHSRFKVIHRDLKPSNILLDNDMNPKISDFGMARMVAIDEDEGCTMRVVGTYGYMSPEYAMFGKFSEKSDIFSFGVLLLEIVGGKRNSSSYESNQVDGLLNYAWRKWKNQTPLDILDPYLKESHSESEVIRCIEIGLLCVQENPDDRPTMAMVHSHLNNLSMKLPPAREPAFYIHGRTEPDIIAVNLGQSANNVVLSVNEMSVSNSFPR